MIEFKNNNEPSKVPNTITNNLIYSKSTGNKKYGFIYKKTFTMINPAPYNNKMIDQINK